MFHSVILNPLSVNLVIPPTITIQNTIPATRNKYLDTNGVVNRGSTVEDWEVVDGCEAVESGVIEAVEVERSRILFRKR